MLEGPAGFHLRLLEQDLIREDLSERLLHGAQRLARSSEARAGFSPRPEQIRAFESFADYLLDAATAPCATPARFCRIILPPRTGKTVIAGHIIDRTGLTTTVVVPTRTLVRQTARLLRQMLPGVPVGSLSMDSHDVVEHGVNVLTYAMLVRCGAALPEPVARSALIFVDEAHRAMTGPRMQVLRQGFAHGALRIGLTATPDYDAERRLCHHFPDLIHEVSLGEALDLGLLAPVRVWVAEVDGAGSRVRMVA